MVYRLLPQTTSNVQNILQDNSVLSLWNVHLKWNNTTVIIFIPFNLLLIFWIYLSSFLLSLSLSELYSFEITSCLSYLWQYLGVFYGYLSSDSFSRRECIIVVFSFKV